MSDARHASDRVTEIVRAGPGGAAPGTPRNCAEQGVRPKLRVVILFGKRPGKLSKTLHGMPAAVQHVTKGATAPLVMAHATVVPGTCRLCGPIS